MATLPGVSTRRVCRVLNFSRARLRGRTALAAVPPRVDAALAERIQQLIERHPTFGYRRLWALLRFGQGIRVNRKAVYRVLGLKGWLVHQRAERIRPDNESAALNSGDLWVKHSMSAGTLMTHSLAAENRRRICHQAKAETRKRLWQRGCHDKVDGEGFCNTGVVTVHAVPARARTRYRRTA